jgi:hypothetical protein
MMLTRIAAASLACAILALLAFYTGHNLDPVVRRAQAMLGERWYTLSLNGQPFGYWATRSRRDPLGRWIFESEQRSALNPESPVTVSNRRVFGARPPYPLLEAEYRQGRRDHADGVNIARTADGYTGTLVQAGAPPGTPRTLAWRYDLADYLAFEVWLNADAPAVGTARTILTLDFERMDVVPRQLTIVGRNELGYQIENPSPHAGTRIQLDAEYVPREVRLAGLFDLTLSSRAEALAPRGALPAASYFVPLDRPLPDHTRLKRVELAVQSSMPADRVWRASTRRDGEWILTLQANPLSNDPDDANTSASLGIPSNDLRIRELATAALSGAVTPEEKLASLLHYVHGYLAYAPDVRGRPVLDLLDNPIGDCTEFADLFTTLARSAGFPTRTVFGLAYSDADGPAFAFHAWNEIELDGRWRPVDPTWDQLRVDATHLPLPVSEQASLLLLTGAVDVRFAVRDTEYFD